MTENLKRCPFCNAEAELHFSEGESGKRYFWVSCKKCSCSQTLFDTPQEAISAWNNRPIEDAQEVEIKRLREALEHVVMTDTTVDKWGIWRIDGKTFQTWAADVLKGNEND